MKYHPSWHVLNVTSIWKANKSHWDLKAIEEVLNKASSCKVLIVWVHWNCGLRMTLHWASRGDELDIGWAVRLGIITVISTEFVQQNNTVPRMGKLKCWRIFERKDCDLGFGKQDPGTLTSWVLNAEEAWQLVSLLQCQVRAWWRADQPQQCWTFSTYAGVETALGILDLFTCHYWVSMCHVYNTCVNVDGGAHVKVRGWRSEVRV